MPVAEKSSPPEPINEYLRFLIDKWEHDGRTLKSLAQAAGVGQSVPSQLKAKTTGAGFTTAEKLAKPLGYGSLEDLVKAAYAWWNSSRVERPDADLSGRTPVTLTIERVAGNAGYSPEEAEIAATVAAFCRADSHMSDETALELLARARFFLHDSRRSLVDLTRIVIR